MAAQPKWRTDCLIALQLSNNNNNNNSSIAAGYPKLLHSHTVQAVSKDQRLEGTINFGMIHGSPLLTFCWKEGTVSQLPRIQLKTSVSHCTIRQHCWEWSHAVTLWATAFLLCVRHLWCPGPAPSRLILPRKAHVALGMENTGALRP